MLKPIYIKFLFANIVLLSVSATVSSQVILSQYKLNYYRQTTDSLNHHSSFRTNDKLPFDSSFINFPSKGLIKRKLFNEHLIEIDKKGYSLNIDLHPDFLIGKSFQNDRFLWLNTRGVSVNGTIGKNLYFYSDFFENQGKFPSYIDEFANDQNIIPGQGRVRKFGIGGYDYAYSTALISYTPSKYFNFQLGNDKNFIGDGYRSILLSDNNFNYPFLKVTAGAGRLKYMSMWAQFIDLKQPRLSYENGFRKKYGVFHYLDWNITDKLSFGAFESIIWQDADSVGKRGFDVSYLNPIIFLRPVEFANGSPDNALMGTNLKYKITQKIIFYGQFLLDEFLLKEILAGNGWWANKYNWQLGARYIDIFKIKNLNAITEFNSVRPYTYSSRNSVLSYSHHNQALAHPLGSNFREFVSIAEYSYKRFFFKGEFLFAFYGLDRTVNDNAGKNIFLDYTTMDFEYGNHIGNGVDTDLYFLSGQVSWLINPKSNLRLETGLTFRKETNVDFTKEDMFFTFGLRSTFRNLYYDF